MLLATDTGADVAWQSSLMDLLSARLSCGAATGLTVTLYDLQKVHDAFNFLRSGSNIGKVVVCSAFTRVVDVELRHDVRPAAAQVRSQCSAVAISLQEEVAPRFGTTCFRGC